METLLVNDFSGVNLKALKMPMFIVYFNTTDFGDKYVVRLWDLQTLTKYAVVKDTLEEIANVIPNGFHKMPRHPQDDEVIVETWL